MDEFRDPEELVRLARESGFTDAEIVRGICRASALDSVRAYARRYSKYLGISEADFVRVARGRSPRGDSGR